MFSVPYMVKTATLNYGYANDDILNDAISTISSVFNAIGEIIGPLFGGFVTDYAGSHTSFNVAALMTFTFAIVFAVGTDTFYSLFEKKQSIYNFEDKEGIKNDLNGRLLS